MGIDFKYCSKCGECHNEQLFRQCQICFSRLEFCDECDGEFIVKIDKINIQKIKEESGNDDIQIDWICINKRKNRKKTVICGDCKKQYYNV